VLAIVGLRGVAVACVGVVCGIGVARDGRADEMVLRCCAQCSRDAGVCLVLVLSVDVLFVLLVMLVLLVVLALVARWCCLWCGVARGVGVVCGVGVCGVGVVCGGGVSRSVGVARGVGVVCAVGVARGVGIVCVVLAVPLVLLKLVLTCNLPLVRCVMVLVMSVDVERSIRKSEKLHYGDFLIYSAEGRKKLH